MANSDSKGVMVDLSPAIKVYKDGTVVRLSGSPFVPPSLDDPTTGVSSKDITISPSISARMYLPKISDPNHKLPILVFFHGGRFVVESAFSSLHHRFVNVLVSEARAVAVSVEYRLAPEHPLPAALEDGWAALQWVASHVVEGSCIEKEPWLVKHGDFNKIYVGGNSAGGNIAHNMAIRAGVESLVGDVKILGGFLSHPYFWDSTTKKENNEESMPYKVFMFAYPLAPGGIDNPMINPLADGAPKLSGLACSRLFVCTSQKDQFREINLLYVEALKKNGWKGELELVDVDGEDHCFEVFNPETEKSKSLITRLASFIRD
ncbi:2-hydroxyisoflavanone dehydratase-like [Coffea arabica]|uniref:2-hydroxyisoflavanone dehydratase-like n=1 Tax=Coffea arabica TaxID=13443 RepID=A0A6P6X5V4_COFAR